MRKSKAQFNALNLSLFAILIFAPTTFAATLKERLEQQTDFVPTHSAPAEQLIEVARQFNIPMAIEWLEQSGDQSKSTLGCSKGSVLELIKAIVHQSPEHQLIVGDRILHICAPAVVSHPFNFLNLLIGRFSVRDESLFGAEAQLRTWINMQLYPELYRYGHNGGYGGGHPHVFWEQNITLSGRNLTIRDVLIKIAEVSGKALWIVKLNRDEFTGKHPKWLGVPIDQHGHSPLNTRWRFIPLSEERSER